MKKAGPENLLFVENVRKLLLRGSALRSLCSLKHRVLASRTFLHQDGQPDRGDHEDDRAPDGQTGKNSGCRAGAKRSLRTLPAEGSGQISALALLKQNDADEHEAHNDVNDDEEIDH